MRSAGLRIVTAVKNRCSLTSWNIGQPPADPGQPPEDTPSTARPDTGCHWRCKRVSCQRGEAPRLANERVGGATAVVCVRPQPGIRTVRRASVALSGGRFASLGAHCAHVMNRENSARFNRDCLACHTFVVGAQGQNRGTPARGSSRRRSSWHKLREVPPSPDSSTCPGAEMYTTDAAVCGPSVDSKFGLERFRDLRTVLTSLAVAGPFVDRPGADLGAGAGAPELGVHILPGDQVGQLGTLAIWA